MNYKTNVIIRTYSSTNPSISVDTIFFDKIYYFIYAVLGTNLNGKQIFSFKTIILEQIIPTRFGFICTYRLLEY